MVEGKAPGTWHEQLWGRKLRSPFRRASPASRMVRISAQKPRFGYRSYAVDRAKTIRPVAGAFQIQFTSASPFILLTPPLEAHHHKAVHISRFQGRNLSTPVCRGLNVERCTLKVAQLDVRRSFVGRVWKGFSSPPFHRKALGSIISPRLVSEAVSSAWGPETEPKPQHRPVARHCDALCVLLHDPRR